MRALRAGRLVFGPATPQRVFRATHPDFRDLGTARRTAIGVLEQDLRRPVHPRSPVDDPALPSALPSQLPRSCCDGGIAYEGVTRAAAGFQTMLRSAMQ